ncbi:unnamed protein product [Calypogeia fissa]
MASAAMRGLQSSLATVTSALGHASAAQSRSYTAVVGLPALRHSAKSSSRKQSSKLQSQLLSSFNVSIPSLRESQRAEAGKGRGMTTTSFASDPQQLKEAKEEVKKLLAEKKAHGILIRLGWHDAGTYDKNISAWPNCGGANGSLRFVLELGHAANAGLVNGVKLLDPIKEKFPGISYADLFQLASATAIEDAGGPKIPMKYGRVDTLVEEECSVEGNLPAADPPKPADHLRQVFHRMGLSDKEIVALSGAHTIGRSRPERSGFGKKETKYTNPKDKYIGNPGGQSWTVEWLTFDNSYFKDIKAQADEDLLVLPTDKILTEDPEFKVYTDKYAEDQDAFFADYAEAHKKLSELGSKFEPPEGFSLEDEAPKAEAPKAEAPKAEKFVASNYSSGSEQRELSDTMKAKIRAEYLAVGGSPDQPLGSNYFLNIIIVIAVLAVLSSLVTQN